MKREISAGCVIYRVEDDGAKVVLIRPKDRATWALPKGLIEKGETSEVAARREAREETGLEGEITARIDTIKYSYNATWENPPARIFKIVIFFLMACTGGEIGRHDWEVDRVEWFPIDDAISNATYSSEKQILRKAKSLLAEKIKS